MSHLLDPRVSDGDTIVDVDPWQSGSTQTTMDPRALSSGTVLAARYRIVSCIGRGGMATVYRAEQLSLGRDVAVKVLHHPHSELGRARFAAEASLTAELRHPNVVEILDFDASTPELVFMVMELLDGEDLLARMRREGPLPWAQVRELMRQICAGLAAAHAAGVTHRDLKPANCFCVETLEGERIKLLDFGIARPARLRNGRRLTLTKRVLGTPEYMAPEQAKCERVDGRSDVYAAGIILGELLTGRVPFEAKSVEAVIGAQIYEPVPRLRDLADDGAEIDPAIEAIYARALAKDPNERFASVTAMAEAIAAVDGCPRARPRIRSLVASIVAGVLAIASS